MTQPAQGTVEGPVNLMLRAEGAAVLVAACYGYSLTGSGWGLFALLLLAPDLFMLGYLANPRLGATIYNLGHSYLLPAILAGLSLWTGRDTGVAVSLIWFAHIGLDRMIGYGLKYPDHFRHSHLSG